MDRVTVINTLIEKCGYTRYLEIGCQQNISFDAIRAPHKVGVDPVRGGTIRTTSDKYFARTKDAFDVIFIDGDHHHAQVHRDIKNALAHLRPNGTIVMHDCLPPTLEYESVAYCHTAWRAFAQAREEQDLEAFCCDFDFGVGIVRQLPNSAPISLGKTMDDLTYDDLVANRATWMRPVNFETFLAKLEVPTWLTGPLFG